MFNPASGPYLRAHDHPDEASVALQESGPCDGDTLANELLDDPPPGSQGALAAMRRKLQAPPFKSQNRADAKANGIWHT
jgi:hypothetical protein